MPLAHTQNEVKTLILAGGIFFLLCAVVGLAKAGISSKTLISCSPLFWLAGIIICGLFLRLCDAVKDRSRRRYFPEPEWNSTLAASELGVFMGPRMATVRTTRSVAILSLTSNDSALSPMTRKSSLPRYDELLLTLPQLSNVNNNTLPADEANNENDDGGDTISYDNSDPPSYSEAMMLYRVNDSNL